MERIKKTEVYNGKGEIMFIENGTFTWYGAGSNIRLNTNQMYLVGENQLIHLDQEGNKPTGDLALHYVLNKQTETPIGSSPIENKKWILTQFQGSEIPYNTTENFILFDASTKQMSTKVGCNSISGSYQIVGELGLKFESMLSTLMACPNNNLEDEYTEALRTVDNFTTDGEFLHLNRARMIVASFKILK
jgi:heat shock protein HslJ